MRQERQEGFFVGGSESLDGRGLRQQDNSDIIFLLKSREVIKERKRQKVFKKENKGKLMSFLTY
jgi:hypothetical protein